MDWFRSWHGAPTDTKWLLIARKANVAPGIVSAVAWALFDHASQAETRGSVATFDVETYAAFSGFAEDDIANVLAAMRAKRIIDTDGRLANWDKRQPKREDDSTPRVKAFRERQNEQNAACNAEKRTETQGNAPEQIQIRADTEPEKDDDCAREVPPDVRAVRNAYDACGIMLSKTHLDAHLETIQRTGLPAWQQGYAKALDAGKHNIPNYVARCAESAMLEAQAATVPRNGNGKHAADPLQAYSMNDLTPATRATLESMSVERMQAQQADPLDALLAYVDMVAIDPSPARVRKQIEREIDRLVAAGTVTDYTATLTTALERAGLQQGA